MKRLLAVLTLVLLPIPAYAQDFDKGREAYERKDYASALREWRPLAERGDARSQLNIGTMYQSGKGVPTNYARAALWHHQAAMQGEAEAQYSLGLMYQKGWGVPQDYVKAYMWFNIAAVLGVEMAPSNRDMVSENMTTVQIAEAQRKAREWLAAHPQ
jgi:TPR repeat protein